MRSFSAETIGQPPLRAAITEACRLPEEECVAALAAQAALPAGALDEAKRLVTQLRAQPPARLAAWLGAYPLGSPEGLALMGLAEALLRIPDHATQHDLLRDKLAGRKWQRPGMHTGTALHIAACFAASRFWPIVAPFVRIGAASALRRMGRDFVLGESIEEAKSRALPGYLYSYDMLGEAAMSMDEADSYYKSYEHAILSLDGDRSEAISVKLSALHPRYTRLQRPRVMEELLPRLAALARLARARNIAMTIDAEEADRLDLSLDLLEALCQDESLANWNGLGFVVQAYQKRAPFVLDFCIDLARRTDRRLMIRLVKGAYWDHEIKQAQTGGFEDFPVFTRKHHTDISYLACARKLLAAPDAVFPQFATHNALTICAIRVLAGDTPYEFQCLHGMGEGLYGIVRTWPDAPPCRIYAPAGPHRTLLAYLVRRLLENGANSSFLHLLYDPSISPDRLVQDPLAITPIGPPLEKIKKPPELFGTSRVNSSGLDLSSEATLRTLIAQLSAPPQPPETPPQSTRAAQLLQAASLLESSRPALLSLLIAEARKTIPDSLAEIREAVDFLRYYAARIQESQAPLGNVACISPWNFPLAIFLGQIAGAYAAGNVIFAKPAEETPRIAEFAVNLLYKSGIPPDALHLIQGDGAIGAALVADSRINAVAFTGSTEAARAIARTLAARTNPDGTPVPLIAETAGLNAMIIDSSALPEQAIADILYSAFNSAGQRCSALRLLCIQKEAAREILPRLKQAMIELRTGPPGDLATDIPPLITIDAASRVKAHIESMRARGFKVTQSAAPPDPDYVPPAIIEIPEISCLEQEVFGPVLHIAIFGRKNLGEIVSSINALGYGLTFGLHSRIDSRIANVTRQIQAGNIYVNRNMVGAVVGVQPFGGENLSGTGPKSGGPLFLPRLSAAAPADLPQTTQLPGPVGEQNLYALHPRGLVLCIARTEAGRAAQAQAVQKARCTLTTDTNAPFSAVLLEGGADAVLRLNALLAMRPGPIVQMQALTPVAIAMGASYNPAWLVTERVTTTNTAAAGGNAALMASL